MTLSLLKLSRDVASALLPLLLIACCPIRSRADETTCNATTPCVDDGSFCDFERAIIDGGGAGACVECDWHSHLCFEGNLTADGADACFDACHFPYECSVHFQCPDDDTYFCNFEFETHGYCEGYPDPCNATTPCDEWYFCNFENEIDEEGVCEECDWHSHLCFESNLTTDGVDSCFESCFSPQCLRSVDAFLNVNGADIKSNYIAGGVFGNATGPLVDVGMGVGDLDAYAGEGIIPGSVCLIERGEISFYDKVANCKANGGVGAVIFNNQPGELAAVMDEDEDSAIPSVTINSEEGGRLRINDLASTAFIHLIDYGEYCTEECSVHIPCSGNHYCNFDYETHGYCEECSGDGQCYFSGLPLPGAQDCAETCGSSLTFDACKLCGEEITGNTLGTAASQSDTCVFCPSGLDPSYVDAVVPMFGDGISCFHVDEYFRNYNISTQDTHCQIGLMYNHICGCQGGTGYAGADTPAKRKTFVWLPRCTAIVSFIGSSIIIFDIARSRRKRSKMNNQMMAVLSLFDLVGSVAYALTSLPAPEDEGVYGSKGNDATCTAQGFFIQLGTIAAYLNVSLAVYYLFTIKYQWNEAKLKRYRACFFGVPILVGLAFAFAGIPFYTNTILWCNNGTRWWPEIPIILAILIATITMAIVCYHVYQEEKASSRWRQAGTGHNNSISRQVFWQSFWYLMVFYLTWPPYLVLQYLWSSGKAYSMYGFVLFAGTLVTMQGFWNCFAFKRSQIKERVASLGATVISTGLALRSSTNPRNSSNVKGSTNAPSGQHHVASALSSTKQGKSEDPKVVEDDPEEVNEE